MPKKACATCGVEMDVKPALMQRKRFCSRACAIQGWKGVRRAPGTEFKKGNLPPNYRGGEMLSDGYVFLRRPDHPRASSIGYVAQHILVCEEKLGRPIPKGWVVHHLNGERGDNRPENLEAIPRSYHHQGIHIQEYQRRIKELEGEVSALRERLQRQS